MTGAPWTGRERAALALNAVLVLVLCTTWAANEQACDLPPGAPPHGVNAGAAGDAAQALVQAMEEEDGRGSAGQDASSGAGGWSQPPPPPPPPVTVNLNSSLGSALLVDGSCLNEHFLRGLANHFATQANQAMCGIATAIMLLNALALPRNAIPTDEKYSPYSYFTVDSFFQNVTLLTASDVTRPPGGVGMQDMPLLLRNYAHADSILASDIPNGVAGLRRILRTHMAQQGRFLAVNYHRRAGLQQEGGGHWAPVGAYNLRHDMVLLLDPARYKYPPVWVGVEHLYESVILSNPCGVYARPAAGQELGWDMQEFVLMMTGNKTDPRVTELQSQYSAWLQCRPATRGFVLACRAEPCSIL